MPYKVEKCAYCGIEPATDREDVFPKNLYPASKVTSRVQRLKVPACRDCNGGFSDDEVHFRNVLGLAGEPNPSRSELWNTTITRSFTKCDGPRRLRDLVDLMRPVTVDGQARHMVYPGDDPRVIRIVKKVVRGLSHHHEIRTAVAEPRVWADVMKYETPTEFLGDMNYAHREQHIAEYRYAILNNTGIESAWLITFFERVTFIGLVSSSPDGFIDEAP